MKFPEAEPNGEGLSEEQTDEEPLGGYIALPGKVQHTVDVFRRVDGELVKFKLGLTRNPEDSAPMVRSSEPLEEVEHTS